MINTRDIILKLKEVRAEKQLSLNDIAKMTEKNDPSTSLSKSTIQRVFKEGSEDESFNYEKQLKPIASVLLDIDVIEETDSLDTQAMKAILQYKSQRIAELERINKQLDCDIVKIKLSNHEKLDKEREIFNERIEFLKNQIDLKDKRMDQLLDAVFTKDKLYNELLEKTMHCHCCPNMKGEST